MPSFSAKLSGQSNIGATNEVIQELKDVLRDSKLEARREMQELKRLEKDSKKSNAPSTINRDIQSQRQRVAMAQQRVIDTEGLKADFTARKRNIREQQIIESQKIKGMKETQALAISTQNDKLNRISGAISSGGRSVVNDLLMYAGLRYGEGGIGKFIANTSLIKGIQSSFALNQFIRETKYSDLIKTKLTFGDRIRGTIGSELIKSLPQHMQKQGLTEETVPIILKRLGVVAGTGLAVGYAYKKMMDFRTNEARAREAQSRAIGQRYDALFRMSLESKGSVSKTNSFLNVAMRQAEAKEIFRNTALQSRSFARSIVSGLGANELPKDQLVKIEQMTQRAVRAQQGINSSGLQYILNERVRHDVTGKNATNYLYRKLIADNYDPISGALLGLGIISKERFIGTKYLMSNYLGVGQDPMQMLQEYQIESIEREYTAEMKRREIEQTNFKRNPIKQLEEANRNLLLQNYHEAELSRYFNMQTF